MEKNRITIANVLFVLFIVVAGYFTVFLLTTPSDRTDGSFYSDEYFSIGETFGEDNPLKAYDLVYEINGKTLQDWGKEIGPELHKGDELTYSVKRNGEMIEIPVTLGDQDHKYLFNNVVNQIISLIIVFIGYLALISGKDTLLNLKFYLAMIAIGIFSMPQYTQAHIFIRPEPSIIYQVLEILFTTLALAAMSVIVFFFATFPVDLLKKRRRKFILAEAVMVIITRFLPYFIASEPLEQHAIYVKYTTVFWNINAAIILIIILANAFTIRSQTNKKKHQIKIVLIGLTIPMIITIPFTYLPFLLETVPPIAVQFSYWSMLALPISIVIAMRQYNLFEIRQFFDKTLQYALSLLISAAVYTGFFYILLMAFDADFSNIEFFAAVTSFVPAIVFITPIRKIVRKLLKRVFHRKPMKLLETSQDTLSDLSNTNRFKELYAYIRNTFCTNTKIKKSDLLIFDLRKGFTSLNHFDPKAWEVIIDKDSADFSNLENLQISSVLDESPARSIRYLQGYSQMIPIRINGSLKAVWLVGQKESEDRYYPEELETLDIIAKQIGLTLHNAELILDLELKAQKEKEVLEKEVELNELKSEYVAVISHYMRTPLTAINGYLELLSRELKTNKKLKEYTNNIEIGAKKLHLLIERIIAISSLEKGTLELSMRPKSLNKILSTVIRNFKVLTRKYKVKIESKFDTKVEVLAERKKLKEAISNIIENAIVYNKPKGTVFVTIKEIEDEVIIKIRDEGRGISKKELKKIFIPFHRAHYKKEGFILGEGPGLGLYLSRLIIKAHGGTLEVDSEVKVGTTVTITLPRIRKKNG